MEQRTQAQQVATNPMHHFYYGNGRRPASVWLTREVEGFPQPITGTLTYADPNSVILDNETLIMRTMIAFIVMGKEQE